MTFDKEEVLAELNRITKDNWHNGAGEIIDFGKYFNELKALFNTSLTQAYQAGRREERERIALEVASYAQLSVDETKYLLKIIKEED